MPCIMCISVQLNQVHNKTQGTSLSGTQNHLKPEPKHKIHKQPSFYDPKMTRAGVRTSSFIHRLSQNIGRQTLPSLEAHETPYSTLFLSLMSLSLFLETVCTLHALLARSDSGI
ncbi:hypothetical protein HanXRQr2_Chr03g0118921 [Helianthus annuus]|uniref:Uncharacterized protein n=1 Tax=Helianthus annuus TaxID=4232 RepID=A0A9K3NWI6_HELAN|nr:hypothetical protein HanXRQr2_Chr03g0118921 [Helianthus annuus]KAJ0944341.1 hypothetical protein HanPSC8_Chr03g0115521 [Helianthus annuus]